MHERWKGQTEQWKEQTEQWKEQTELWKGFYFSLKWQTKGSAT
jgi:hypothetical protein